MSATTWHLLLTSFNFWSALAILAINAVFAWIMLRERSPYVSPWPYIATGWAIGLLMIALNIPFILMRVLP